MRKLLGILLASTLVFSLTACGGSSRDSEAVTETSVTEAVTEAVAPEAVVTEAVTETSVTEAVTEAVPEAMTEAETTGEMPEAAAEAAAESADTENSTDILIAYFSWSGNTEALAEMIQAETGGDLFRIETVEPYTDDYDTLLEIAQTEQQEGARPQIAGQVEDWDSYNVIFVGYPNWWSDAPMAVYTFLESYDFTGKTLIPFNTSASGGFGRSLTGVAESAAGAEILDGFTVTGDNVESAGGDVSAWISGLGL